MDYREYHFTRKELAGNLVLFLGLAGAVGYLFYRSWIAFALCMPFLGIFLKKRREDYCRKRRRRLEEQFLSGLQAVSTALTAGYSVETAFEDACEELQNMYEEKDMIMQEFRYIASQLKVNRNLEELLKGLAVRSDAEDIRNFAEIFSAAKRTGGDLIAIIRNTARTISQKEETRREIDTSLASKRLEQNIMSLVPALILLYVQLVSPGFLDGMYHNPPGIAVMTVCLLVYGAAYFWGRSIVNIEV